MPIIYVTRDIERALGMKPGDKSDYSYFIITNSGAYAEEIKREYPEHVFLIDHKVHERVLDTYELLAHPTTEKIIAAITKSADNALNGHNAPKRNLLTNIVVFKNTSRIEKICADKNWKLINPPAALAEKIENKITQIEWLGAAVNYLPAHEIIKISDIDSDSPKLKEIKKPFVIQWAHSHTGLGTILVPIDSVPSHIHTTRSRSSKKILADLREKFPHRGARITEYIKGPMFTVNICTSGINTTREIRTDIGNISYQITGIAPFTDNPFSTIGNDWSLPHSILSERGIAHIDEIAHAVARKMTSSGWYGLFGIDCVYDEERDTMHLIEVNARQPASTTYESQLQEKFRGNRHRNGGMTIFEAHIAALIKQSYIDSHPDAHIGQLVEINDGAQIIERLRTDISKKTSVVAKNLREKKYTVIEYENRKPGSDLLRIQSERGIMEAHTKFNSRGKEIVDIISGLNPTP